jgi:hypothetical protein
VGQRGGEGQQTKQGKGRRQQLFAGVGACRRLHPPGNWHGSWQDPPNLQVLLAAREGSSVARDMRCREATSPRHTCASRPRRQDTHKAAEPFSKGGPSQPAVASARQGDTCTAHVGAGGSSAGSQAG